MRKKLVCLLITIGFILTAGTLHAGPKVVSGPGHNPTCFAPWNDSIKYFQWKEKKPPYRIAVANGFVGNTWRIQMIKTAKAFVKKSDIAPLVKELKVVSTGTDAAAQLGAIEDFINQGYDAIVTIAVSPTGFDRVIRLANRNDVVLVPFDNVLDTDEILQVNQHQLEMGRMNGQFLDKQLGGKGKILEVRGLPGNSVDRDRHLGFREIMEGPGKNYEIIEVVGNWDDGHAQKAVADALAVHQKFDGMYAQGGSAGSTRALMEVKHAWIPIAGEAENGFRKLVAKHGIKAISIGQSPGLVAISIKAAISALQGHKLPQLISVPIPVAEYQDLKDGVNYWSNMTDNFFTANEFPPCGVNITGVEIMAETEKNN